MSQLPLPATTAYTAKYTLLQNSILPNPSRFSNLKPCLPSSGISLSRRQTTTVLLPLTLALLLTCGLYARMRALVPPRPLLLPPAHYQPTLHESIFTHFPDHMRERLSLALDVPSYYDDSEEDERDSSTGRTVPSSAKRSSTKKNQIPNVLHQTDKSSRKQDDKLVDLWRANDFERVFHDDADVDAFVERHFNGSEVARVFRDLPLPILKADMARYLFLLAEGGVYADMDIVPHKALANWTENARRWSGSPSGSGTLSSRHDLPIRLIVGIEGDFHQWRNSREFLEGLGVGDSERYRGFQIVQWTMAAQPGHPVMVDVIRRIIETNRLAESFDLDMEREVLALEAAGDWDQARKLMHKQRPWEVYNNRGRLAVQEWSGPAAFTDSVMSYLLSTSGVRESDLYALTEPVQIGDVLVLPINGFNPRDRVFTKTTCVEHRFRGSWKTKNPTKSNARSTSRVSASASTVI